MRVCVHVHVWLILSIKMRVCECICVIVNQDIYITFMHIQRYTHLCMSIHIYKRKENREMKQSFYLFSKRPMRILFQNLKETYSITKRPMRMLRYFIRDTKHSLETCLIHSRHDSCIQQILTNTCFHAKRDLFEYLISTTKRV